MLCHSVRLAGLKGLRGVIKKTGREEGLQLNIWDINHMNKIVPPFLFNMQEYAAATGHGSRYVNSGMYSRTVVQPHRVYMGTQSVYSM